MDWRRGFFRIWLVLALGWALIVGYLVYQQSAVHYARTYLIGMKSITPATTYEYLSYSGTNTVVIGPSGEHLVILKGADQATAVMNYESSIFATDEARQAREARVAAWWPAFVFAVVPPLVLLGIGAAIGWAVSGFRRARPF